MKKYSELKILHDKIQLLVASIFQNPDLWQGRIDESEFLSKVGNLVAEYEPSENMNILDEYIDHGG